MCERLDCKPCLQFIVQIGRYNMKIKELEELLGIPRVTIRFYEKQGLIAFLLKTAPSRLCEIIQRFFQRNKHCAYSLIPFLLTDIISMILISYGLNCF